AGAARLALSRVAPAGKPRAAGGRLESDRDRPRSQVLPPHTKRPLTARSRDRQLAALDRIGCPGAENVGRRRQMNWLGRLFHGERMDEQLDKELRFHLDQQIAELVAAGLSPDEARRQANLAFGGTAQVQEMCREARGTRWLEDLLQDFRYSCRL